MKKINYKKRRYLDKLNDAEIRRKTKILICNEEQICSDISLVGILLKTVQSFTCLGSKITSDGIRHTDKVCVLVQVKQAYYKK